MKTYFKSITKKTKYPWAVDRIGRLISGISIVLVILSSLLIDKQIIIMALLIGFHLIISSLNGKCFIQNLLLKYGAKEREEIFNEDGSIKQEKNRTSSNYDFVTLYTNR